MSYLILLPLHLKFSQYFSHHLTLVFISEKEESPFHSIYLWKAENLRAIKNKYPRFKSQKDLVSVPGSFHLLVVWSLTTYLCLVLLNCKVGKITTSKGWGDNSKRRALEGCLNPLLDPICSWWCSPTLYLIWSLITRHLNTASSYYVEIGVWQIRGLRIHLSWWSLRNIENSWIIILYT